MLRSTQLAAIVFALALVGCEGASDTNDANVDLEAATTTDDTEETAAEETTTTETTTTTTETVTAADVVLPNINKIQLTALTDSGSGLALSGEEGEECEMDAIGTASMALSAACHVGGLAAEILMGEGDLDADADGNVTCADYDPDSDEGGLMFSLICEDTFLANPKIVGFAFDESDGAWSVRFDQGDANHKGTWTAGNATASFPAMISIATGETLATVEGAGAIDLTDLDNGTLTIDFGKMDPSSAEGSFPIETTFNTRSDVSNCAATPTVENCHYQEVRIYAGEGAETFGPPNGFHIRIISDGIEEADQTFLAVEGEYRYTAALAASQFAQAPTGFSDIRYIYYRVVQKGNDIYGEYRFEDGDRQLITATMGNIVIADYFAAGVCTNTAIIDSDGEADNDSISGDTCPNGLAPADFEGLWVGKDQLFAPESASATSTADTNLTIPNVFDVVATFLGLELEDGTQVEITD